jgi:hypothetical protein
MPVIYFAVVPFDRSENGDLVPGEAKEVASAHVAERAAARLLLAHAGL